MRADLFVQNDSIWPTGLVCDLIAFAVEDIDTRDVGWTVRTPPHPHAYSGRALPLQYWQHRKRSPWKDRHIMYELVLNVGKITEAVQNLFWVKRKGEWVKLPYGGYKSPLITVLTWQEALIVVAAHEMQHVTYWRDGQKNRHLEAVCEQRAYAALERFKEGSHPITFEAYRQPPTLSGYRARLRGAPCIVRGQWPAGMQTGAING
jgi:hypothetical protein